MQYSFLLWPLEQPYMASPRKPTQLKEFQDVAFEATISTAPAGKIKKVRRSPFAGRSGWRHAALTITLKPNRKSIPNFELSASLW